MSYQNSENPNTVGNILEQIESTLTSTENTQPSAEQIDRDVGGTAMRTLDNAPEVSAFREGIKKGLGSRKKKEDAEIKVASNAPITSLIPEIHQLLKEQVKQHNYNKNSFGTDVAKSIRPQPNLDHTDFLNKLATRESTNNYRANNKKGYFGLIQMGQGRLSDYNKNNDTEYTTKQYLNSDNIQDTVNKWHIKDIDRAYYESSYENYPNMDTMTLDSFRAVAHLGGIKGAKKYVKTKKLGPNNPNKYNPADSNGTRLSDYDSIFFNPKGKP